MVMQLHSNAININLIQVYAPTTCEEAEVEKFYTGLNMAIKQMKDNEIIVLMGDFNAKVGNESEEAIVEK